ncbi:MAG: hypothetical protein ACI4XF_07315 [Oscillospiraceae bacterium]
MDDLSGKIGEILSDEESMKQIRELADMLTGSMSSGNSGSSSDSTESFDPDYEKGADGSSQNGFPDLSALMGMLGMSGGASDSSGNGGQSGGIDMGTVMKLISVIQSTGDNDKNRNFLIALKPLLGADKQEKIDKAIKLLRMYSIFLALKDSGIANDLENLL